MAFKRFHDTSRYWDSKVHCADKCKRPDCELYYSSVKLVDIMKVNEPLRDISSAFVTTKQYDTTFQAQMSFAEFVIYFATYLGILFGIDALCVKSVLKAIGICFC